MIASRLRRGVLPEEEDAAALKLGPGQTLFNPSYPLAVLAYRLFCCAEFNDAGCLLISEVNLLLENRDKDAPDTA